MTTVDHLQALIDRFRTNQADYLSQQYREAQVRQEFLDPCFRLLGWDLDNESGQPTAYREVVTEEALRTGSGLKAPDYSFRLNGQRKFFTEAKRPQTSGSS